MSSLIMAILGGVISGAFSAGVIVTTLRFVLQDVRDANSNATRAHVRLDEHIGNHAEGVFK